MLIRINTATLFAYRGNFYSNFVVSVGWGVVSILQVVILTNRANTVYGWSRNEIFLLAGFYSMIVSIFHMFFSTNFERFSRIMHLGQMDGFLLKPVDVQFLLTTTLIKPLYIIRFAISVIFTGYVLQWLHVSVTFVEIVESIIVSLISLLLMYTIWMFFTTFTVWFTNLSNIVEVLYITNNTGRYPPAVFLRSGIMLAFILLPLSLISSVPARVLIGKVTIVELTVMCSLALILFYISRKVFLFALKSYTGASG